MNLTTLTTPMMLDLSARWLSQDVFTETLEQSGPLGLGVLAELEAAHQPLVQLEYRKSKARADIRALTEQIGRLDYRHDKKARALNGHLSALAEGADSPALEARYTELLTHLFPNGLRATQLPYVEQSGAAVALVESISEELRAKLESVPLGEHTLATLFDQWMDAARELGEAVHARTKLRASLRRDGSAHETVNVIGGRRQWIRAVRGLLWALEMRPELAKLDETVLEALRESIDIAQRRRAGSTTAGEDPPSEAGSEEVEPAT